jgi:hypothetical protein
MVRKISRRLITLGSEFRDHGQVAATHAELRFSAVSNSHNLFGDILG